ncbi:hypothetical protein EST38_g10085 [Candolleomyces aberdarensis]|uniref:Uncharacterized protein n=1 Tax=Candolleomyces aberdarensis TaxID=2316362 RepID=A0A4Q2D8A9_9AGAR|nr:hypothetical protein EST38_g10085 [Candolleomyces aberdarensis]
MPVPRLFTLAEQPTNDLQGFELRGQSFSVQAPQGAQSFSWKANFPTGSRLVFFMTDAQGRNGGTSQVQTVGASSDTSCLATRPSATSNPPYSTTRGGNQSPSNTADNDNSKNDGENKPSGSKIGIIIGAVAGGFVFLGALAFFIVFCFKRKKNQGAGSAEPKLDLNFDPTVGTGAAPPNTYLLPSAYTQSNSNLAPNQSASPYAQDSQSSKESHGYQPSTTSTSPLNPVNNQPVTEGSSNSYPAQQSPPPASASHTYSQYSQDTSSAAGSSQAYGYGAAAGAAVAAGAVTQGYHPDPYQQQQHPEQQYPHQQYPQQQQYPPQQYPTQQYPPQQQYPNYQYQQPYQQQYGQQQPYQQYPQGAYSQGSSSGRSGGRPMYATNADARDSYNDQTKQSQSSKDHKAQGSFSGKSGAPPPAAPTRVVVHQDIDEAMDMPEELPPQYSESRAPIPGLPNSHDVGGSSQGALRDRKG